MNIPPQRKEAAALAERLLRLQWGCLKSLKLFVPRMKVCPLPDTCRPVFFLSKGDGTVGRAFVHEKSFRCGQSCALDLGYKL